MTGSATRYSFLKLLVLLLLAAMAWAVGRELRFGTPGHTRTGAAEPPRTDDYYIANAQRDTGANNAVTSIVFDYRGFDTLGEATVLVCAVMGVGLALRRRKIGEECDE